MTRNPLTRPFVVDRRRLVEARTARACEEFRLEMLMLRPMQQSARAGASRTPRARS